MKTTLTILFSIIFLISYSQKYRDTTLNVRVLRMDNYDSLKLQKHVKFIKEKFGYQIEQPNITINSKEFLTISNSFIDVVKLFQNVYFYDITIIFTNNPLYESPIILKGGTEYNRKAVIIDGNLSDINMVIIHEISHALGLQHCENSECVMFDTPNKEEFCNKCINFFK